MKREIVHTVDCSCVGFIIPLREGVVFHCVYTYTPRDSKMSAEPGRKSPHSSDLRWRIVWQRMVLELTFEEISTRLNIAQSTARRIYKLFEATGNVSRKQIKEKPYLRSLDHDLELFIIGVILERPSIYVTELCQLTYDVSGMCVSESTICRVLHKCGVTRKQMRQVAVQRSTSLRGYFMARVLLYRKEQLVWLDETGCDNKTFMRKYGYAIRGQTPCCHRLLVRGRRISVVAVSTEGIIAYECFTGSLNSGLFFDFVRGKLIPQMHSFDGSSPKSVLIMDNCSVHHVQEIQDLLSSVGIPILYLPPWHIVQITTPLKRHSVISKIILSSKMNYCNS